MDESNYYMLAASGGLLILHASQVQPKNTSSALVAGLLSIAFGIIAYWACGFAFAGGLGEKGEANKSNFFLSYRNFFLIYDKPDLYTEFGDNVIVLIMVIVICCSGFAARMRCWIYPILSIIISGFLFPCAYHWIYHPDGWLKNGVKVKDGNSEKTLAFEDAGKAGIIHIFGGAVSLIGTIMIGNRKERKDKRFRAVGGNLNPLIVVGGLLTIVGLVARNSKSSSKALINNLLAAQASAVIAFTLKRTKVCGDPSATKALINGAIAGLVGVSVAPAEHHPYGAFVIGVVTGLAYVSWTALFQCCRIDDPTDSAAVHLGSGLWAVLAAPLFSTTSGLIYKWEEESHWRLPAFGWQLLGGLAIFVWAGLTLFIVFLPFWVSGLSSYKESDIQQGLDVFELDDPAFPDKSQYSRDMEADDVMADIIPASLPQSYDNKAYGSHRGLGTLQRIWDQDQDWSIAQY